MAITDREFWPMLKTLIPGLQDEIVSIDIHCAVNEPVTMTIKSYVKDSEGDHVIVLQDHLLTEIKQYKLIEIEESDLKKH